SRARSTDARTRPRSRKKVRHRWCSGSTASAGGMRTPPFRIGARTGLGQSAQTAVERRHEQGVGLGEAGGDQDRVGAAELVVQPPADRPAQRVPGQRSEERRVGKGGRCRQWAESEEKKTNVE